VCIYSILRLLFHQHSLMEINTTLCVLLSGLSAGAAALRKIGAQEALVSYLRITARKPSHSILLEQSLESANLCCILTITPEKQEVISFVPGNAYSLRLSDPSIHLVVLCMKYTSPAYLIHQKSIPFTSKSSVITIIKCSTSSHFTARSKSLTEPPLQPSDIHSSISIFFPLHVSRFCRAKSDAVTFISLFI
jgi:hypothetical protein